MMVSEITIANAKAVASQLDKALVAGASIRLETARWTACDMAGMSVLIAAFRTAQLRKARLQVTLEDTSPVPAILAQSALTDDQLKRDPDGVWVDIIPC
ncbi:STAS domain-containing protein [Thioclava sp. GXIMD2076]|uniref:STAS domain-containing protein n=1 Tax=Thioclava kandeliae TaxID=3070818 RepID=A0ABV1SET4_9RHOB